MIPSYSTLLGEYIGTLDGILTINKLAPDVRERLELRLNKLRQITIDDILKSTLIEEAIKDKEGESNELKLLKWFCERYDIRSDYAEHSLIKSLYRDINAFYEESSTPKPELTSNILSGHENFVQGTLTNKIEVKEQDKEDGYTDEIIKQFAIKMYGEDNLSPIERNVLDDYIRLYPLKSLPVKECISQDDYSTH